MKKHIVTCVKCGRQFDANEGGAYYPESRRYVCNHCVDKQKDIQKEQAKARKAAEREAEADDAHQRHDDDQLDQRKTLFCIFAPHISPPPLLHPAQTPVI